MGSSLGGAARLVLVRLRFVVVFLVLLVVVGYWDHLRNYWDRLMQVAVAPPTAISPNTEYWCPMCPGVLSDWPGKCPVCNMALVRRTKGEAVPLPDGVLARMQLSPYRVQLAGVRTAMVAYQPLQQEVRLAGRVERNDDSGQHAVVAVDVFERDAPWVTPDAAVEAWHDALPGRVFLGQVLSRAGQLDAETRLLHVQLKVDDAEKNLVPGMAVQARLRVRLAATRLLADRLRDAWQDRTLVAGIASAVTGNPAVTVDSLVWAGGEQLLQRQGLVLTVPESAVIDTGARRIVYVEAMPGTFDAKEVTLGRRCGDHYPVLRGLEFGERIVATGAFLVDAETRLNPSVAISYFGAGTTPPAAPAARPVEGASPAVDEAGIIARQKICPVTLEPLGSMGPPQRVALDGRVVYICCKGCEKALRREPAKYLARLP